MHFKNSKQKIIVSAAAALLLVILSCSFFLTRGSRKVSSGGTGGTSFTESAAESAEYNGETETAAYATASDIKSVQATPAEAELPEAEKKEEWSPSAGFLNMTRLFPDGADQNDPLKSYGGEAFRKIYETDSDWYANIYESTDLKPEEMAARLGKERSAVLGKYNILDAAQNKNDPNSWTVSKWGNINVSIVDGNKKEVDASSSAKQILSMASVYGYYHDWTDYSSFIKYATSLWESTRSYSISMGDVYYDQGCITEEKKNAAIAKMSSSLAAGNASKSGEISSMSTDAENETATASDSAGTETETTKAYIINTGSKQKKKGSVAASESSQDGKTGGSTSGTDNSQPEKNESAADSSAENNASASASGSRNADSVTADYPLCPGHIDLTIHATVYGMDGENNLFRKDKIGNSKAGFNDRWQGWTEETMAEAKALSESDWFRDYGLSISAFSKRVPLSDDEIYNCLSSLPADLSIERRKVITCALRSIGNIPYYFGGKPSAPDYEGNRFFTTVSPDYKGRIFKGLDCSGWISWVYWTALGKHLSESSTAGLANLGKSVRRDDLKPGDIIVRPGSEETIGHVILFLSRNENGTVNCIHETGGRINNVTMAEQEANWNYRNLLD
jgi:hypothetical protein